MDEDKNALSAEPPTTTTSVEPTPPTDSKHSGSQSHIDPSTTTKMPPPPFPRPNETSSAAPGAFPDGSVQAWLAVLGAWCCYLTGFGWISSIGVFQTYYSQHQLRNFASSSIAWILSVEVFMLQVMAPVFGKIFDNYGPRVLVIAGTLLHVLGLMMVSLADRYYSLFLAQSICSGLGAAALYHSSTNAVSTWFLRKRALVLGIIGSGSSLGGLILP